ncbi:TPA: hypothetical protein ACJJ6G_001033, partial [Neisseria meningitidis]
ICAVLIYVDAGYVAFFRKIQPAGSRYAVSSLCLGRVGGADTTLVLVSVISSFFSSREYIDSRRQVLDTAFSYKSDGRMVLFKSIKQESISFLSEDLKKDWMFHKVKTGEKDGYGSDEMLSVPRVYLEMMSRKTGVPYSSIL